MKNPDLFPHISRSHLFLFTGLACVALLLLTIVSAKAQSTNGLGLRMEEALRLRPIATVESDVVRLGDLIEGAGRHADVVVFGAPQPGTSGMISTARVVSAARDNGMGEIETSGMSTIAVRRLGRRVTAEEISKAVASALSNEHQLPKDMELELVSGQMEVVVESAATDPVLIRSLSFNGASGRFEATYVVPGSRALEVTPGKVVGSVADVVRVPVLSRAILRGDVVVASDITMERRRRSDMGPDVFTDIAKVVGNAARRPLPRGTLLREADIQRPEAVERNANVIMSYENPGLQLAMRGKAQQAGAIGDVIQVQNINSKKIVEATVTGPGRVTVTGVVLSQKTARNSTNTQ
ncbi:MAG: flagellar basal body P-ring formation chaperone FlgA [Beijerinckiaceae bacterium]